MTQVVEMPSIKKYYKHEWIKMSAVARHGQVLLDEMLFDQVKVPVKENNLNWCFIS